MLMPMDYTDKYIKILEEENTYLKQRNAELEAQLKDTKKDLLTAIDKWDEAVNKLHKTQIEFYTYKRESLESTMNKSHT
jgi:predicted  nucleic acid-binding Zn-ribbon protein